MPIAYGGDNITFADGSKTTSAYTGFKNRIINGAMMIDQRNAGASVTVNGGTQFGVDRFFGEDDTDGAFTLQQSTVAPAGFTNSLLATITTADTSLGSTQLAIIGHRIEGYNIADLNWGSANAKTVTLSFWVRSSLTGTFGGALWNSAGDRSYPYSYTISSANTWEQKTITIAGDTTGTWLTTNGRGISISWSLGVGSTYQATAGSWVGALELSATGATSVIGTNGATFYLTGVQLEPGSSASTFDYRPYGTELALCQRYYWMLAPNQTGNRPIGVWSYVGSTTVEGCVQYPVKMRTTPSLDSPTISSGYEIYRNGSPDAFNAIIFGSATDNAAFLYATSGVSGTGGQAGSVYCVSGYASYLGLSAEL